MDEITRYIGNLLSSISNRIRFNAENAVDKNIQNAINQQMDKRDNTKRQEP